LSEAKGSYFEQSEEQALLISSEARNKVLERSERFLFRAKRGTRFSKRFLFFIL